MISHKSFLTMKVSVGVKVADISKELFLIFNII